MNLVGSSFCQTLIRRHRPRTVSDAGFPLHINSRILRHKRDLWLVYRRSFRGIILRDSSRSREMVLHTLIRNTTYIFHAHDHHKERYEKDSPYKTVGEPGPINNYYGQNFLKMPVNIILPAMRMTSLSSPMSSNSKSLSSIAQTRFVSRKSTTREPMTREPIKSEELGARLWHNMTAFYDHSPLEPNFSLPNQATVHFKGDNSAPPKIRQRHNATIKDNRSQSNYHTYPGKSFLRVPGYIPPEMNMASVSYPVVSWPNGLSRSFQSRLVGRESMTSESIKSRGKDAVQSQKLAASYSPSALEPKFHLPPQAIVQLKADKSPPVRIIQRYNSIVPGYRSQIQYLLNPNIIQTSQAVAFPSRIKRLPTATRQKENINDFSDSMAGIDNKPAQTTLVNRIYAAAQTPPAEMEYGTVGALSGEVAGAASGHSPFFETDHGPPDLPSFERVARPEYASLGDISKPPAINISKLSDQVYSIIERKIKIERERRGIYV